MRVLYRTLYRTLTYPAARVRGGAHAPLARAPRPEPARAQRTHRTMVLLKTIITLLFSVYPAYHHPWRQSNAPLWRFDSYGATVRIVVLIVQSTRANKYTYQL